MDKEPVTAPATRSSGRWTVDRSLLPVKGLYFFILSAIGDLLPFLAVYMKQLGLDSTETGIIYGTMPFVAFFIRPIFGMIADKTHKHKYLMIICCVLSGLFYGLLLVTPKRPGIPEVGSHELFHVRTEIQCGNLYPSFIKDCVDIPENGTNNTIGLGYSDRMDPCEYSLTEWANLTILHEQYNLSDVTCQFHCDPVVPGEEPTFQTCYADKKEVTSFDTCLDRNGSIYSEMSLMLSVSNMSNVFSKKPEEGVQIQYGKMCRDYNLTDIVYRNKPYKEVFCDREVFLGCHVECGVPIKPKCTVHIHHLSVYIPTFNETFWIFFIFFLLANLVFSPTVSLIDAIAYDTLGQARRGNWGKQRLFGSIGFAVFAITSTFIMDQISDNPTDINYTPSFIIFVVLCVCTAVVSWFLNISEEFKCSQIFKGLGTLLSNFKILTFLILVTFFGIMTGVVEAFLFWYLKDLGSNQTLLGLCLVCNCISELIFLLFAGKIIEKIGHVACLYLACLGYAVRFFWHSMLENFGSPWWVLPAEMLHGVTFGVMYAAATAYGSLITPRSLSATIQGLIGGIHFGLGKGIGSIVTGKLFDPVNGLGEVWTFRFYCFLSLFLLVVFFLLNVLFFNKSARFGTKLQSPKDINGAEGDGVDGTKAEDELLMENEDHVRKTEL